MSLSRSAQLLKNAEAALISAIEIYNKPTFAYREETFAILALNAWELLLKAKLLETKKNKVLPLRISAKDDREGAAIQEALRKEESNGK